MMNFFKKFFSNVSPEKEIIISELSKKREELMKEIQKPKYKIIENEIFEKDLKANELFHSKVEPTFKFKDDFYYDLAMKYKSDIKKHEFFKDLQEMPKGCLLHHHMSDCIDIEWISNEVMKEKNINNIYMRKFKTFEILVYTTKPNEKEPHFDRPFKNIIHEYLANNKSKTPFDYFYERLTMDASELKNVNNNDEAWNIFMPKYFFCYYLILNKKFYIQHLKNTFMQCILDNQYRIESRLTPGKVRDDEYNLVDIDEEFKIYYEALDYVNNKKDSQNKFSFGIIVEMVRNKDDEFIKNTIKKSILLKEKYPDLICGIDLSGDENNFRTFQDLAHVMVYNDCKDLPWILHCGESIKGKNYNLVDGLLIDSKRFGHCINLFKLGILDEYVKNKGITLEINPISNQTLRQVRDLRIHPCIGYHNKGMKICINCDDPTLYNTKGVVYDFFVSCVAMEFDLLDFKCFGINSINGSQISDELKNIYKTKFLKDWDKFLDYFIKKYEK